MDEKTKEIPVISSSDSDSSNGSIDCKTCIQTPQKLSFSAPGTSKNLDIGANVLHCRLTEEKCVISPKICSLKTPLVNFSSSDSLSRDSSLDNINENKSPSVSKNVNGEMLLSDSVEVIEDAAIAEAAGITSLVDSNSEVVSTESIPDINTRNVGHSSDSKGLLSSSEKLDDSEPPVGHSSDSKGLLSSTEKLDVSEPPVGHSSDSKGLLSSTEKLDDSEPPVGHSSDSKGLLSSIEKLDDSEPSEISIVDEKENEVEVQAISDSSSNGSKDGKTESPQRLNFSTPGTSKNVIAKDDNSCIGDQAVKSDEIVVTETDFLQKIDSGGTTVAGTFKKMCIVKPMIQNPKSPDLLSLDSSSKDTVENPSTNVAENSNSESPLIISSDSCVEATETTDIAEALGFIENSTSETSPVCNFDREEENSGTFFEKTGPISPASSVESNLDLNYEKKTTRSPKKNLTLPYFHLPNPDFEEFLTQTEQNLNVPDINTSRLRNPPRIFEPKDKEDIVFNIDADPSTSTCKNTDNTEYCSDYTRFVSSIDKLDDSKSPGIKRLALRNFLQNKIQENKIISFERAKQLAKIDDEEDLENVEAIFESESSDEDVEEPTVSFDKENATDNNDFNTESHELSNNEDSDDDGFGQRKVKKIHILEDESADESDEPTESRFEDYDQPKMNGPSMERNFSIPSYQPGGGFNSKVEQDFDHKGSSIPEKAFDKDLINKNSCTEYSSENKYHYFGLGLPLQDLPMSQQNESELFSTQDLETVCSGVFKESEDESAEQNQKRSDSGNEDDSENESDVKPKQKRRFSCDEEQNESGQDSDYGVEKRKKARNVLDDDSEQGGIQLKDSEGEESEEEKESDQFIYEKDEGSKEKIQEFFDVEAELSGEDDADDEQEDFDDENEELDLVNDQEMLAEEELRDEIADLHMKKVRDDDEELLKDLKEKFLDDGELNDEGERRKRKFAWLNNDASAAISQDNDDSSSDSDDEVDDKWATICKEKAKWRQEKEEDLTDYSISPSCKKPHLKYNIIGKPGYSTSLMESSKCNSFKRPRGSLLGLDDSTASQVLKKLKTSDDAHGGSRTTKHFVFRNDRPTEGEGKGSKESSRNSSSGNIEGPSSSVFNDL